MNITNTRELRAFLVERMKDAASDKLDMAKARGISNLAQQVYNTFNIELKAALVISKVGSEAVKPLEFNADGKL